MSGVSSQTGYTKHSGAQDAQLARELALLNTDIDGAHAAGNSEAQRKHCKLLAWLEYERDVQDANRREMATDDDFYDGIQYTEEETQTLKERGQAPLVYNKIKPAINWILGTEKRTRVDFTVLPREDDDVDNAQVKTKLLKYVNDVNSTAFARSSALESAVRAGVGWLEDGITNEDGKELLYSGYESWRNIYHDSKAQAKDLSDARYIFRMRWVDYDIAAALFPGQEAKLQAAMHDSTTTQAGWYLGQQEHNSSGTTHVPSLAGEFTAVGEQLLLIEAWYKVPATVKMCKGGEHNGKEYDERDPLMAQALQQGECEIAERRLLQVRVALMTEQHVLYDNKSPYRHGRFPFTPVVAYRRARDGVFYGVIRDVRDVQSDYNKRASKALHILSTNKVITEAGAVEDHDVARQEAARPDSYIVLSKPNARFEVGRDSQLAQEHPF